MKLAVSILLQFCLIPYFVFLRWFLNSLFYFTPQTRWALRSLQAPILAIRFDSLASNRRPFERPVFFFEIWTAFRFGYLYKKARCRLWFGISKVRYAAIEAITSLATFSNEARDERGDERFTAGSRLREEEQINESTPLQNHSKQHTEFESLVHRLTMANTAALNNAEFAYRLFSRFRTPGRQLGPSIRYLRNRAKQSRP